MAAPDERGREVVRIPGPPDLEGLLELPDDGEPRAAVVVSHPHPLHGSTLQQPVVHHVAKACRAAGFATLRYNFRGVEGSEGSYHGLEERRDVDRTAAFMRDRFPDLPLALAGYSFGAFHTALAVAEGTLADAMALVAFAVDWDEFMPSFFTPLKGYRGPVLSVCGEDDDIAPPEVVERFLQGLGVELTQVVLRGADHYFPGKTREVGEIVARFLAEKLLTD